MVDFNPNPKTKEILARAYELVESVPYKVSLRWLFYALLQEGYYRTKKDYDTKFKSTFIKARKSFYEEWRPDTLVDETRRRIIEIDGRESIEDCLNTLADDVSMSVDFTLDHFYQQDRYVEIWFEARAMVRQFQYYTNGIDLVPFGGDPSISFKWEISKNLEDRARRYGKEMAVLYFGDCDEKGLRIKESAENDIRRWCRIDFKVVSCGLTKEQAERYNVPESPFKPGEFQWEALSDEGAREIMTRSIERYIDASLIDEFRSEAMEEEKEWREKIYETIKALVEEEKSR